MTNLTVACSLLPAELKERRLSVLSRMRSAVTQIIELENGYNYQFGAGRELITELANLVVLEHQCCPFLTFRIIVEPGEGPISLEMTGPEGTKEFLAEIFG